MYLLYIDESGSAESDYFVLGGLIVHEQNAYPLARELDALLEQVVPHLAGVELHTQQLRGGAGRWRSVPRETRVTLQHRVAQLLLESRNRPTLLAVAAHKPSNTTGDPYERAYEEYFARANGFMGRLAGSGEYHRCIAIADRSRLETRLQSLMAAWREFGASSGAAIRPMRSFAEVPLFVDSGASRLVQLADFVAHWVFRAYEAQDGSILHGLAKGFDTDGAKMHGLVHLIRGYRTCLCLACASRR
jgi:Protein of unknown function (DUF3800)